MPVGHIDQALLGVPHHQPATERAGSDRPSEPHDHVQRVLDVLELEREARRGAQAGGSNSRRVGHISDSPMNSLRVASIASRVHPRRIPERRFCRGSPNSAAHRSGPPVRFTAFRRWVNPACSNSALDGHTLRRARYSARSRRIRSSVQIGAYRGGCPTKRTPIFRAQRLAPPARVTASRSALRPLRSNSRYVGHSVRSARNDRSSVRIRSSVHPEPRRPVELAGGVDGDVTSGTGRGGARPRPRAPGRQRPPNAAARERWSPSGRAA